MADLSSVWAKLDRAREHATALSDLLNEYISGDDVSVAHDFYMDTGWNELRVVVRNEPPVTRLGLISGDVMSNARSALDHLIWQLVLRAGTHEPSRTNQFPVVRESTKWPSTAASQLRGVPDNWVKVIDELQPYHETDPDMHYLAVLDDLNNLNKHRTLPATIHKAHKIELSNVPVTPGMRLHFENPDPPLVDGAVVFRVRNDEKRRIELPSTIGLVWHVGFSDGTNRQWDNDGLFKWLEDAIGRFTSAFE